MGHPNEDDAMHRKPSVSMNASATLPGVPFTTGLMWRFPVTLCPERFESVLQFETSGETACGVTMELTRRTPLRTLAL